MRCVGVGDLEQFQATPDFKGIKTLDFCSFHSPWRFQATPDFKGIKTIKEKKAHAELRFQATPDFKGIKTGAVGFNRSPPSGFRPPLISKGLRLRLFFPIDFSHGFRPPLISKGLRQRWRYHRRCFGFQATPDFKGIKTTVRSRHAHVHAVSGRP